MELFPVFFGSKDLNVVVFGGGETARRKVRLLAKTHAVIDVVSDFFEGEFAEEFAGRVGFAPWDIAEALLKDAKFSIIAFDDDETVQRALDLVKARDIPVNVVDRPELCDFTVPSILDRGAVVAGIATGGAAPVIAKNIRARLEGLMPQRIGLLAEFAKSFRPDVKAKLHTEAERRVFWERVLKGPVAELFLRGDEKQAHVEMKRAIAFGQAPKGIVHIVGAGPGDPELLTLKALRLLQDADIVFYDFLVGDGILELIRRDADRVCVGKKKSNHTVPQSDIHDLLIAAAKDGKRVVRLKGGDPFIFGRGGEELEALKAEGIEAEVVPGISSALGCAASAGIPLTHRDHAQSLMFITGHAKNGTEPDLDWTSLARANQTVVVYMGVGTAPWIEQRLIEAGRARSTPVAVIENGTRDNEIRAYGQLEDLSALIARHGIKGPALLFIGEVAGLSEEAIQHAKSLLETAA